MEIAEDRRGANRRRKGGLIRDRAVKKAILWETGGGLPTKPAQSVPPAEARLHTDDTLIQNWQERLLAILEGGSQTLTNR
jgi:hypothetical protein